MTSSGWTIESGPGLTALGLAAARTLESNRPDRLVDDPFAPALFAAAGAQLPMRTAWPAEGEPVSDRERLHLHGSRYIGLRTRFYDDALLEANLGQAVLLGAGLDTRAWRLRTAARIHEIDQPAVLDYKAGVLAAAPPSCERVAVGRDLREDWATALAASGFDDSRPAVWIAEGLVPYLDPPALAALLRRITELSAPGSRLALDRLVGDPAADGRARALGARSGIDMAALFAAGGSDGIVAALRELGWTAKERSVEEVAARYGRDLSDPFGDEGGEPPWLATVFVEADR